MALAIATRLIAAWGLYASYAYCCATGNDVIDVCIGYAEFLLLGVYMERKYGISDRLPREVRCVLLVAMMSFSQWKAIEYGIRFTVVLFAMSLAGVGLAQAFKEWGSDVPDETKKKKKKDA